MLNSLINNSNPAAAWSSNEGSLHNASLRKEPDGKTLTLTLTRDWFLLMVQGFKTLDYRKGSPYYQRLLENRDYDFVKFKNGYSKDKPYFITEFRGVSKAKSSYIINCFDLPISVQRGDYIISLGKILFTANTKGIFQ